MSFSFIKVESEVEVVNLYILSLILPMVDNLRILNFTTNFLFILHIMQHLIIYLIFLTSSNFQEVAHSSCLISGSRSWIFEVESYIKDAENAELTPWKSMIIGNAINLIIWLVFV